MVADSTPETAALLDHAVIIISGYVLLRIFFDPGVDAVESLILPSQAIWAAWSPNFSRGPVGALFAAGIAFVIGKVALVYVLTT